MWWRREAHLMVIGTKTEIGQSLKAPSRATSNKSTSTRPHLLTFPPLLIAPPAGDLAGHIDPVHSPKERIHVILSLNWTWSCYALVRGL
jgi:hypothetical protein